MVLADQDGAHVTSAVSLYSALPYQSFRSIGEGCLAQFRRLTDLEHWLRQPVDPATVGRGLGMRMMRFVMAELEFTTDEAMPFLRVLGYAVDTFITAIETCKAPH